MQISTQDGCKVSYTLDGTYPTAFLGNKKESSESYIMITIEQNCTLNVFDIFLDYCL